MSKVLKKENKTKKTVDKMSMTVNQLNERMKTMDKQIRAKKAASKATYSDRLKVMRANPHYQALAKEYQAGGALHARHSGSDDPVHDKSYIADVVRAHVMQGTPLDTLKTTAYVKALVDPEGIGEGAGVPDCVPTDTYRYQSIVELTLGPKYFDSLGQSNIVTTPDIVDHVLLPCDNAINEEFTFINAFSTPFARQGDLFDYNLIDPAEGVPVDTPDFRIHFPGNSQVDGTMMDYQIDLPSNYASYGGTGSAIPLNFGQINDAIGSGAVLSASIPVISKTLNPGRLRVYPFAEAADDLRNESTWAIDAGASIVDKFSFPSQFLGAADAAPHVVYPFYTFSGQGKWSTIGDCPVAHVSGTLYPTATPDYGDVGIYQPIVVVSVHGYRLGSGGGTDADGHEFELQWSYPCPVYNDPANAVVTNIYQHESYHFDVRFNSIVNGVNGPVVFRSHDLTDNVWSDSGNFAFAMDSMSVGVMLARSPIQTELVWGSVPIEFTLDAVQFGYITGSSAINTVNTRASAPGQAWAWNPFQVGCYMGAYSVDQLSQFSSGLLTKYRPVSMSTWLTYVGGTLNDVGEVYGSFIADHRFVADRDHNYLSPAGISSIANAYRGKAPLGAYAIWKPLSERDLEMRSLSSKWNFNRGFTSIAIVAGSDTLAQNYVLRVVANFEVITLAAFYRESLRQSVIDHAQLWGAFQLLEHFPMVMANDEHDSSISSFFSSLWNGVKKAAGFVSKNIGPIADVAKGLGAFA